MKKIIYYVLLIILFLVPKDIYATNDLNIKCDKTKINRNEEISCTISVSNLNFIATDISGQVQVGDNLSITSSSYDRDVWLSLASKFTVKDIDLMREGLSQVKNLTIATFKVKASSNAAGTSSISFKNVTMGDDSYQSVALSSKTISIGFNSNVNTLSNLSVSGADLDFSGEKTNYSVNIDSDNVTIEAEATHNKAKVTGTGTKKLGYGNNTFNVVVTAEDGSKKTYVLNIKREDDRSTNNNLKSLSVSDCDLKFNKTTNNYDLKVSSDIDEVTIKAELEHNKASFVSGFGPRVIDLQYGLNKVLIKVMSENNKEKIYTINITREDDRSKNNNLKDIFLSYGKVDFSSEETEYTVNVDFEISTMKITAEVEDKKSKVEIEGSEDLVVGENIFTIKVTAEDESVKEYKVKIIRDEKVIITDSNKLKNIKVQGYEINFSPDVYLYTVKTDKQQLNIEVELNDTNSTYKINGNDNLKDGSIISIVVTDKTGNNSIYKIQIEEEKNINLTTIILIISILLNIILIIFIIVYIKKKNNSNYQYKSKEIEII